MRFSIHSHTSFILDHTLDAFDVEPQSVELTVSTMTGQNQSISSRKIAGFMVTGHNLKDSVSLPMLYSRPVIPHNRSHFPTREFCDKFKHLKKVSSKINLFPDIDVGLLIGFNCSKATCPLEVIVGRSSDPYAVRTPLGWSVVGSQGTS